MHCDRYRMLQIGFFFTAEADGDIDEEEKEEDDRLDKDDDNAHYDDDGDKDCNGLLPGLVAKRSPFDEMPRLRFLLQGYLYGLLSVLWLA
ncbi:hypothetical protein PoB_006465000 [Plakobranchus ocellatus]|uniref:Uncharacterized protein n=1 Tax=Plakobranchus ocellatus TaxID=259542 RepID=A0AAV4D2E9_9GAST|nr:hypothetical protein PoB_006465000 [Plakobranchus ocellatus]